MSILFSVHRLNFKMPSNLFCSVSTYFFFLFFVTGNFIDKKKKNMLWLDHHFIQPPLAFALTPSVLSTFGPFIASMFIIFFFFSIEMMCAK